MRASMPEDFQYEVFVGHSTKDKAVVRPLAERLRKDGPNVPSDFGFAQPGASAHSFGSDWAQLEAGTFRFRDLLDQERRFAPLRRTDRLKQQHIPAKPSDTTYGRIGSAHAFC